MMWRVVVALLAVIVAMLFLIEHQADRIDTLREENRALSGAVDTYKRLQNADTSRGNSSDDDSWLCKRSPASSGCSGRSK